MARLHSFAVTGPHWMRNAQAYVSKGQQNMVSAALRQACTQLDHQNATQTMRHVADQFRDKWPKLGAFIDDSEADVLAYMNFPAQHRVKIHSTNPIERLNKEVKRRADVVGIFPNEGAIAPPTMLPLSSGGPCWIGVPYGPGMARVSGPSR